LILIHKVIDEHTRYIALSVRFNMRLHSREQKVQKKLLRHHLNGRLKSKAKTSASS